MDLVPKQVVFGLYTPPPGSPGVPPLDIQKLNAIWSEVTSTYDYRQLQISADRTAGVFVGASDTEGVTIQLPLLQVRSVIELTPEIAAEKAFDIFRIVSRHIGVQQFYNLGIRHIFHAPAPDGDGRGMILHRMMGKTQKDLDSLQGGEQMAGGLRFFLYPPTGGLYTLVIEPLFADTKFLYLDLDAQFNEPITDLEMVKTRAGEASAYLRGAVHSYLNAFA